MLFRLYNDKQAHLIIYILFLSLCINRMSQVVPNQLTGVIFVNGFHRMQTRAYGTIPAIIPLCLKERDTGKWSNCMPPFCVLCRNIPKGAKSMNYLMGWVLTYYYNALMYQDKADGSEFLTDSLLNSRHPYYTQVLRPELLAHSCKFYLAQNRMKQVDSIGHLFLSLPLRTIHEEMPGRGMLWHILWSFAVLTLKFPCS